MSIYIHTYKYICTYFRNHVSIPVPLISALHTGFFLAFLHFIFLSLYPPWKHWLPQHQPLLIHSNLNCIQRSCRIDVPKSLQNESRIWFAVPPPPAPQLHPQLSIGYINILFISYLDCFISPLQINCYAFKIQLGSFICSSVPSVLVFFLSSILVDLFFVSIKPQHVSIGRSTESALKVSFPLISLSPNPPPTSYK